MLLPESVVSGSGAYAYTSSMWGETPSKTFSAQCPEVYQERNLPGPLYGIAAHRDKDSHKVQGTVGSNGKQTRDYRM
jgi:hypothetical protein